MYANVWRYNKTYIEHKVAIRGICAHLLLVTKLGNPVCRIGLRWIHCDHTAVRNAGDDSNEMKPLPLASFSFTDTKILNPEVKPDRAVSNTKHAHFIPVTQNGADTPFNSVPAFIAEITSDDISSTPTTAHLQSQNRITLGKRYCAPIPLKYRAARSKRQGYMPR